MTDNNKKLSRSKIIQPLDSLERLGTVAEASTSHSKSILKKSLEYSLIKKKTNTFNRHTQCLVNTSKKWYFK